MHLSSDPRRGGLTCLLSHSTDNHDGAVCSPRTTRHETHTRSSGVHGASFAITHSPHYATAHAIYRLLVLILARVGTRAHGHSIVVEPLGKASKAGSQIASRLQIAQLGSPANLSQQAAHKSDHLRRAARRVLPLRRALGRRGWGLRRSLAELRHAEPRRCLARGATPVGANRGRRQGGEG